MVRRKRVVQNFDPEFRFLLEIDPAFEDWRALVAEWWPTQKNSYSKAAALTAFFVRYLHALQLDKRPVTLFEVSRRLPDLRATRELALLAEMEGKNQHDAISDFLDWVLRTHLAEPDADGHRIAPEHLCNPFPRIKPKVTGKRSDLAFANVTTLDPRMVHWQALAAEWLGAQKTAIARCRDALDKFLADYLIDFDLPHQPITFLTRTTPKPIFSEVLLKRKIQGAVGLLSRSDVKQNNYVADFLDWVLADKLSLEDDHGHRVIPHALHNPVVRLSQSGLSAPSETTKAALSIRYIKELRAMLAEGPTFRDWTWAQQAMEGGIRVAIGSWSSRHWSTPMTRTACGASGTPLPTSKKLSSSRPA